MAQRYSLKETTPPAVEPLDLADVKNFLRIDHSNDDSLVSSLISSAGEICEKVTGLSLINRSYSLYIDSWKNGVLFLPQPPLVSVTVINTYAEDDSSTVYSSDNYYVDNLGVGGRVVLKHGSVAPIVGRVSNGIEVQYVAGFGTASSDIPSLIQQGMKQLIAHLYENRGDSADKALELSGAAAIFKSYRRVSLA